ncbi:MAG: carbonic anhydrase [Methyloligellaceae bacterium]
MVLPRSLAEGYLRFRRDHEAEDRGRLEQLAELGQSPTALIIACCDARVLPQTIFDAEPGELFLIRNVANLVPPFEESGRYHGTSAAIEYAVLSLKVPHVIVLGHSHCGGIAAYRAQRHKTDTNDAFISEWMSILDAADELPPMAAADHDDQTRMEMAAIRLSLNNLRTFEPLSAREREGRLTLHGAHYDIATGALSMLDEARNRLVTLDGA